MLFCHFLHSHVCTYNDNTKIWGQTSESTDGSFEILFVTTKIDDGDDFVALLGDFFPILVFVLIESFREDLFSVLIEAHDFVANRTGSSGFLLVQIVKNSHTCRAIPIIFDSLCQHGDQRGFAGINITNDTKL